MIRSKVNYNMNGIREPSEPMGEDLECSVSQLLKGVIKKHIHRIVAINQINSELYILIQNKINPILSLYHYGCMFCYSCVFSWSI